MAAAECPQILTMDHPLSRRPGQEGSHSIDAVAQQMGGKAVFEPAQGAQREIYRRACFTQQDIDTGLPRHGAERPGGELVCRDPPQGGVQKGLPQGQHRRDLAQQPDPPPDRQQTGKEAAGSVKCSS